MIDMEQFVLFVIAIEIFLHFRLSHFSCLRIKGGYGIRLLRYYLFKYCVCIGSCVSRKIIDTTQKWCTSTHASHLIWVWLYGGFHNCYFSRHMQTDTQDTASNQIVYAWNLQFTLLENIWNFLRNFLANWDFINFWNLSIFILVTLQKTIKPTRIK